MCVSIFRTSKSIFRANRPLKSIIFDFHFFGHCPLKMCTIPRCLSLFKKFEFSLSDFFQWNVKNFSKQTLQLIKTVTIRQNWNVNRIVESNGQRVIFSSFVFFWVFLCFFVFFWAAFSTFFREIFTHLHLTSLILGERSQNFTQT